VSLFTLRINPAQPGNVPNVTNNSATESTCAQGEQESPNPSKDDVKPPSVL